MHEPGTLLMRSRTNARIMPRKTALADSRLSLDYRTLDRFSTRFALWLGQRGCRPGDRVVMLAPRQGDPGGGDRRHLQGRMRSRSA